MVQDKWAVLANSCTYVSFGQYNFWWLGTFKSISGAGCDGTRL